MKNRSVIMAALLIISGALHGQHTISGRVADIAGNGIPGVAVTDGFTIVTTSSDGKYGFKTDRSARFVYLSTPDNYYVANGSFYTPLKKESSEYNFTLSYEKSPSRHFVHMGDTEESVYRDFADEIKNYAAINRPAFIIFNGDICYEKGMRFHANEMTSEKLGARAYYTLGNHDLVAGEYGEQMYESLFGPVWYSFTWGGVHFIMAPVNYGDKVPSYKSDDVYRWIKRDLELLKPGTPIVYVNHHLNEYNRDFDFTTDAVNLNLGSYNLKAYLHAHYHTNVWSNNTKGVAVISTMSPNKGGIDHSPSSFRVIRYDENGNLSSELRYSSIKNHIAVNLFKNPSGEYEAAANIYNTGADAVAVNVCKGEQRYPLTRRGSWMWSGKAAKGSEIIEVTFADGTFIKKAITYPYADNVAIEWSSKPAGGIFMAAPVIKGEIAVVATFDDDNGGKAGIRGIDTKTGEYIWHLPTSNSVKNSMATSGNRIYAIDVEGFVYCADISTGKLLWRKQLREKGLHPLFTNGLTISGGLVYAGMGNTLCALNEATGEVVWKNDKWNGGVNTVASPVVDSASGVLLSSAYWLGRFAHNSKTGALIWQKRDDDTRICDNTPVVFKGKFFYTSPGYITVVDPLTGTEEVKEKINYTVNNNSRPFVNDEYYITGTTDKGVVAYDRKAGYKELWNFKCAPALLYTAPYTKDYQMTVEGGVAVKDNRLYFGANDGWLYCVNITNGLFVWKLNLGAPLLSNVVIDGERLYVSDMGGTLWCINLLALKM